MATKQQIIDLINLKGEITSTDVVQITGITRQVAARHLSRLIEEGVIHKLGSTRTARYILAKEASHAQRETKGVSTQLKAKFMIEGLAEDLVFNELAIKLSLGRNLGKQAFKIVNFAFTEMLNNAIDHSQSKTVEVRAHLSHTNFLFEIEDKGLGIFENVRKKFGLNNTFEATEHLLKGKQTTAPEKHSGQGIFFTSKAADRFIIRSNKTELIVDNAIGDYQLQTSKHKVGTTVVFSLKRRSKRDLKAIFDEYTSEEYEFDKTLIKIRLSGHNDDLISRSQAKRILFGLDDFKRIVLDFKGVKGVGQGFVDEIFRVFKRNKPEISVEAINMNEAVRFMIDRSD